MLQIQEEPTRSQTNVQHQSLSRVSSLSGLPAAQGSAPSCIRFVDIDELVLEHEDSSRSIDQSQQQIKDDKKMQGPMKQLEADDSVVEQEVETEADLIDGMDEGAKP